MPRWAAGSTPLYSAMAATLNLDDGVAGDTVTGESADAPNGLAGVYVSGGIDLGAAMEVDEIRITGCASNAGGYHVWYSTDDVTYTSIDDAFPGWFGCQQNTITFPPVTARYWRGRIVDQDPGDGPVEATITDLRLYNNGSPVMVGEGCDIPDVPTLAVTPGLTAGNIPVNHLSGS